jgi:arylsulfatase A-like enzyme
MFQQKPASAGRVEQVRRFRMRNTSVFGLAVLAVGLVPVSAQDKAARPNVILILADDLGWGETGPQGGKDIPTPALDSLAKSGVRFTNGYVSCPLCSPTRAGLLSGRYQQRFGHEFNPGPEATASDDFGMDLKQPTIADRMKALGYATGMFGKWHLGYKEAYTPPKRGFDEFYGFLGGAHPYLPEGARARGSILRGAEAVDPPPYLTDAFGGEAVSFIEKHKDVPFFVYLPFNAVHSPLQAVDKYLKRFEALPDRRKTFAAMLSAMDDNIGRVLDKLRELKIEERTLIFFLSDNGGPTAQTTSGNGPLRGFKGQTWEGGIRIPFMIQWKGKLPEGKVSDVPVISLDILPTAVAAAGRAIDPAWKLDGVNLLPYLTGENAGRPHESLFWRMGEKKAARVGDWKMVVDRDIPKPALFNLAEDIGEKNDLAEKMPEKFKEIQAAFDAWEAQLEKPRWGRVDRAGGRRRQRNP